MMNAFLLLVALLFAPSAHSLAPASVEEAGFSLRGASESSGVVDVEHRQLSWGSGFDFSNLLCKSTLLFAKMMNGTTR